jgi:hypothetical protein
MSKQGEQNTIQVLDKSLKDGFSAMPRIVLRAKGLSRNAKCLYSLLLDYAWQEGSCFPGQERLARDLNISVDTVRKDLNELKEYGLISWVQRGLNKTNIYYINSLETVFSQLPEAADPRFPETVNSQDQEAEAMPDIIETELIDSEEYKQSLTLENEYLKNERGSELHFKLDASKINYESFDKEARFLAEELNDKENIFYYQKVIKRRNIGEITDFQIQTALQSVKDKLSVDKADGKNFWKKPGAMFNKKLKDLIEKSKQSQIEENLKSLVEAKSIDEKPQDFNQKRNEALNKVRLVTNLN